MTTMLRSDVQHLTKAIEELLMTYEGPYEDCLAALEKARYTFYYNRVRTAIIQEGFDDDQ